MKKIEEKKDNKRHAPTPMNFGVREQSERGHAHTSMNFGVRERSERGFVILIAVLVAGIFTVIGASILLISIKELELSAGGTQSQYAFYAADTGMECALYWDLRFSSFATTTGGGSPEPINNMYCAGFNLPDQDEWDWLANNGGTLKDIGRGPSNNSQGNTIFSIDDLYPPLNNGRDDCVLVYVIKEWDNSNNRFNTYIESRGYNTCDSSNPRRVERALRAIY